MTDFDSTCDLYDRFEKTARVADPVFHDFGQRRKFSGAAVTVKCFEDNSRVKETLGTPGQGKVLVVDGGGGVRAALMGDLIAKDAVKNGWEGVVIHGCVRDAAVLATLDLGIKALAAIPRKTVRNGEGQRDLPVTLAGIRINPGDLVFADEDGVLVLTPEEFGATA
ncbi:ribonuclease activity regulator protein RraA (plasmid) [Azospirillum sp. TSH58]|uniref:ribonuclease E activity regulator RraA n=1 Tax=Azospirillum sp. TSH58 TaxID=664962 RepID=UPI000D5FF596|nr:ribonuclease E activity regulator RraA [Azospirillum sp. TSH58]AWJ87101.1 ribonuclease activity regulator protein RraA [Azospirillum sp. TSH58]PWC59178.1 ribonuclease activity regulator protein RraA [Azospirillum sp. TSH58]